MLPQHKEIFFAVAQQLNCWIGLREPNDLADQWIGKPGFVPKGVSCKAKTSDSAGFQFAGLVTDPTLCPEAFQQKTIEDAREKWKSFAGNNQLPGGYTCEKNGREKGLVKYHGNAIHADYDLMAVCNAGADGEIGYTTEEDQKGLFTRVERLLNMRFNTKMIQHGSEFMYKDGVGARETESVYFFGPNRKFKLSYSSMPKKAMAH